LVGLSRKLAIRVVGVKEKNQEPLIQDNSALLELKSAYLLIKYFCTGSVDLE